MDAVDDSVRDVMQVCRNGHVTTDLLRSCPERGLTHCDRCGATTMDHCLTCGRALPGAIAVLGFQPVGVRRPPLYCAACGAAFPWAEQPRRAAPASLEKLEDLLRRLPRVIRQLRVRHGDRSPFRVTDERDLEDLLRALLPLHFDDIRPQCRTPRYAAATRTGFLLAPEQIAVAVKFVRPEVGERQLVEQIEEDAIHYRTEGNCRTLVGFLYDPEGLLSASPLLIASGARNEDHLEVRWVLGTFS
jgi:REase_DpnII-MboI/Uncharacterized protein conserved in bacteria (DUF2321)